MTITSSVIVWNEVQTDGRHSVREVHTDDSGNLFTYDYMCDDGFDVNAKMQSRVSYVTTESDNLKIQQALNG